MLRILFILTTLLTLSANLLAQTTNEANKVSNSNNNLNQELSAPTQDVRSSGYFKKEADVYEAQSKESPSSAQAWLNLYKSSMYSYYTSSSKTINASQKQELDDILSEMKTKVPGTFEYNIAVYLNGQHNTGLIGYLEKAAELNPNQLDVIEQYTAYYAITG